MSDSSRIPKGLVFFSHAVPPARRRRRLIFVAILLVTAVALVWPGYTVAANTFPLLFGLPLSLAWLVGWLGILFAALIWLYRTEK